MCIFRITYSSTLVVSILSYSRSQVATLVVVDLSTRPRSWIRYDVPRVHAKTKDTKRTSSSGEVSFYAYSLIYYTLGIYLRYAYKKCLPGPPRTNLFLPRHQQYAYQIQNFPHQLCWYSCTNNYKFIYEPRNNTSLVRFPVYRIRL